MPSPAASRANAELEKQLLELSRLRNANTRDSDFKVWRQATLTLIQRVWEGDDSRSGRFRSVPFSPGSTKANAKLTREWFERGCAEAAHVLRGLIEEINEHGIIKGPSVAFSEPEALPEDESVPILSLDANESGTGISSIPDEPDDLRLSEDVEEAEDAEDAEDEPAEIPDPPGARPPKPLIRPVAKGAARSTAPQLPKPTAAKPPASKPAAPQMRPPVSSKRPSEPQIPMSETAPSGPSRGVTVTNGGNSKSGGKKPPDEEKLQDMLGFEPGSSYSPPVEKSQPAAREEVPHQPTRAQAPPRPAAPAPQAQRPVPTHAPRPAAPAPRAAAPPRAVAPQRPAAQANPPGRVQVTRPDSRRPGPPSEKLPPMISSTSTPPLGETTRDSIPPDDEPWPVEPPSEPEPDAEDEEATLRRAFQAALEAMARRRGEGTASSEEPEAVEPEEDLLGSSPVFNVSAKPAKRHGLEPEGRYHTATSIAMAAIATEVEAMGVPATDCSLARATLLELADHFERRDLTWDTVRDALRLLVAYPVVARRVLPLLVPHLDEAA